MAKNIAVTFVLMKISHLRAERPATFLGIEDQIQRVEYDLKKYDDNLKEDQLRDMIYDLEGVIDEFLISSARIRSGAAVIQYVSNFVHLPNELFFVLALVDLLACYRLRKLLRQIKFEEKRTADKLGVFFYPCAPYRPWQWLQSTPPCTLNLGSTLISPVISKFEALASQNKLISSLRKQARWLRDEFSSLEGSLQNVDSRELSEEGMVWIEEFFHVCRSAENTIGLFIDAQQLAHIKKGRVFFKNLAWVPHNFISQHKLAQQMNQIQVKVRDISRRIYNVTRVRTPHLDNFRRPLDLEQGISADQLNALSFEEDINAINSMLLKDDPRCLTISIVGVGGTGKTSLAKLIFHNKAILDHFPHRYWISGIQQISNVNYPNKYFDNGEASGQYEQHRWKCEENLRQRIIAQLTKTKFLIVVNHSNVGVLWDSWATSFSDSSNGTRIIFLVRQRNEAPPHSDTNLAYSLHLRSDEQSWELFKHSLKANVPVELEVQLKTNILKKCGGLPKVIVKLGEQLSQSQATLEEWSKVLENLIQDEGPWSEVLQVINSYLPLYLRRCLFHFGMFPVGYKIPKRRLLTLWIAEGLRDQRNARVPTECVAEMCLRDLVNFNMVQITTNLSGKIKTCSLPEALRRHWFSKAQETNKRIGVTRYLIDHLDHNVPIFDHIHGKTVASAYSTYRDTMSFLSFDTREGNRAGEDIGNFLDRCISNNCFHFLWILDLEHVYRPQLPKAVEELTHLRYLGLRWTYLEMIPTHISKLFNLQTLDLKHTSINNLPASIWKMRKLNHLFLNETPCFPVVPQHENSPLP